MVTESQLKNAKNTFETLRSIFDEKQWHYNADEEDFSMHFGVIGEDIPMDFHIVLDVERELILLFSPLPFNFKEDKRVEGAIATCQINYVLAEGSFDYDIEDGTVLFKMTSSFKSSLISKELLDYMIACATYTVDKYNDMLMMLSTGLITLEDAIKKIVG